MEQWKSEYMLTVDYPQPTLNDQYSRWNTIPWGKESAPMTGMKNVSPFRVLKRRKKNKAARKARRKSQQNAELTDR